MLCMFLYFHFLQLSRECFFKGICSNQQEEFQIKSSFWVQLCLLQWLLLLPQMLLLLYQNNLKESHYSRNHRGALNEKVFIIRQN